MVRENTRREIFRLSTFSRFPPSVPIDARQFAAAGFYHTGRNDEVKCFACSNALRNLSARTDPFLLSMHTYVDELSLFDKSIKANYSEMLAPASSTMAGFLQSTCRFARGQDECGNERLGRFGGSRSCPASTTLHPSRGGIESGTSPLLHTSSPASSPASLVNFATEPQARLAGNINNGHVRQYQGLDIRNYQTARPVPPPTYDVPLHRQLATIQNANQARLIRSLNLCRETDRYQTFNSDWPLDSAPSGREMAASGWFYLGNLDRTQCFSCGGVLRNWRRLDNPNTEHISHFLHCSMAQGREIRNIPDTGRRGLSPNRIGLNELTAQQRSDLRNMFPCEFPVTPSMRLTGDRVNSFNNWNFTQATPQMLAEAGFFSLGLRDRVKCFYCNGGLQNWRQNDNPWEEHAKWYPTCEFLLQQRGPEYIHTIVARFPNINRPILHAPGQDVPPPSTQVQSGPENLPPPPPARSADAQTSQAQAQDRLEIAMRSEVAAVVIGMGFEESLVRDVMRTNIEEHGVEYQSAIALLDAVEAAEQEAREIRDSQETEHPSETNAIASIYGGEEQMEDENFHENGMEAESGSASSPSFSYNNLSNSQISTTSRIVDQQTRPSSHTKDKELEEKLRKKLQELKDERLCKVCLDRVADVVFIPCGHICCCLECTRALKKCPICRKKLEKAVRTYTS